MSVDGQPITTGTIEIVPRRSGQGKGVSAPIVDGKYTLEKAPLGPVIAMLVAERETGRMVKSPYGEQMSREMQSLIPSRYASGIPLEIVADKATQDFKLEQRERFDRRLPRSR